MLPTISVEQKQVIDNLVNHNVIVDSVAGSGKTTCSLYIAIHFPTSNFLLLTYNSKLKLETRERVNKLGIQNLEVHSYHSFCVKNYDKKCYTDTMINSILKLNTPLLNHIHYDTIILDESQDITPLYYELFCKIYRDNKFAKLCIFGDIKQSIFEFNNSDERFIKYAHELFNFNHMLWKSCKLSQSFRITNEMSSFINHCMLNDDRLISQKVTTHKPRYIICDCFEERPLDEVKHYLHMGYQPQDIFILAPSIKTITSPVRILENKIKLELNLPVYVPTSDDEKLDTEILQGKLVFSTFHQTKGLERKVIIVYNFDNSYFKFYKKTTSLTCPNELYVATTRGLEHLSLLHHNKNDYLSFICKDNLELYCDIHSSDLSLSINKESPPPPRNISPTDLVKHIPQNILDDCFDFLEIKTILSEKEKINIPIKSNQSDGGCESVSEITGVAIPSYFELKIKGKIGIFNELIKNNIEGQYLNQGRCLIKLETEPIREKYILNNINPLKLTTEELLYISNCWCSYKNGFLFKKYQIQEYNWLSTKNLLTCISRMEKSLTISVNAKFEQKYSCNFLNNKINGFVDCIDNNNLYEFKCVQTLKKEHFIQLAIYMFQYETEKKRILLESADLIRILELQLNSLELKIKLNEYNVGDVIIYKVFNNETGIIKKIYKNGKIMVLNNKHYIPITKSSIISLVKKSNIYHDIESLNDQIDRLQTKIKMNEHDTNYYLYNILTDELLKITCELNNLQKIMELLIHNKYNNINEIKDDIFIKNMLSIKHKYFS
jgi:hypothetical protein